MDGVSSGTWPTSTPSLVAHHDSLTVSDIASRPQTAADKPSKDEESLE